MNVYDFDGTIYEGDSTLDFWIFCLKKKPRIIVCFPHQCLGIIKYKFKLIDKTTLKETFFCFLTELDDIEKLVKEFWNLNEAKIMNWYKENQREEDLVISASPYFLLSEICKRQNIKKLVASDVDSKTGHFNSNNCYGEEKVKQFEKVYPTQFIDEFYSDSYSDTPLASIAQKAYLVKKGKKQKWKL